MLTSSTNADTAVGAIIRLTQSWAISLSAENRSPRTIGGYTETLGQFVTFLTERGMPLTVAAIRREHVETYLIDVLTRHRPSTRGHALQGPPHLLRVAARGGRDHRVAHAQHEAPVVPEEPPTC